MKKRNKVNFITLEVSIKLGIPGKVFNNSILPGGTTWSEINGAGIKFVWS